MRHGRSSRRRDPTTRSSRPRSSRADRRAVKGAIAAGHPLTAEAGARILADGGNAVDACLGAAFVSWVAESTLTGPGGGGFLLVHRAREGRSRLLDFFVSVPGAGVEAEPISEMEAIDIDFDDSSTQAFGIGVSSVATPGVVAGLETAHRAYGRVPWATLFDPAIAVAREGVVITPQQAYLLAILDVILRHTDHGRAIYGPDGERLEAGDRLTMNDLASTMEILAEGGAEAFYDGVLAERISSCIRAGGGPLTRDDLRGYRVIWRRPITADFLGQRFVSNPPPSTGGVLI
ncbi:MAG: gamma-glutamyltransferase, partial [Actinobacteria bacterium]